MRIQRNIVLVLPVAAVLAAIVASFSVKADEQAPATKELPPVAAREIDFVKDIQPLLARCTNCHGIEQQESGLNLQDKAAALAGGDNGKVFVPGKSDKSRLAIAVSRVDP